MKTCEHGGCGNENRFEYCEAWSPEMDDVTNATIELLDMLLIADVPWKGDPYLYRNGVTTRAFTYRYMSASQLGGYLPFEERIAVCHQKLPNGGDSYSVRSSWRQLGVEDPVRRETDYLIEQCAGVKTQMAIWEQELMYDQLVSRTLTLYDMKSLLGIFKRLFEAIEFDTVNIPDAA